MRVSVIRICLLGAVGASVMAAPLLAAPADTVNARIQSYKRIGASFKVVNDQLKSGSPQVPAIQGAAKQIQALSRQQYRWFPAGTGQQSGVKTRAKAEIWTDPKGFKAAQDGFARAADGFAAAAATGDVARISAASRGLGGACAACHRSYRAE